MTGTRDVLPGNTAVVALLVGAAAYPLAVAFEPPTEPLAWSLAVASLVAVAAGAGAGTARDRASVVPWPAVVGLLVSGACADVLVRTVIRLVDGAPLGGSIVSMATVVTAGLVAGGWAGGRALAARMDDLVERSAPPGHVQPVSHVLLVTGCLTLAAAGWTRWVSPADGWSAALVPLAVLTYGVTALAHHQRLRRAALVAGWRSSGRIVDPAVARNWSTWVVVFLLGALGVVILWWTPPAEPLRRTAEEASPQAAARFWDYFQQQRLSRDGQPGGQVAGESMPADGAAPPDEERRVITIRELPDWLLQPATTFEEGEATVRDGRLPDRWAVTPQLIITLALLGSLLGVAFVWVRRRTRRGGVSTMAALTTWLARFKAALAAMFGRRDRGRASPGTVLGGGTDAGAGGRGRRLRQWRRPSSPRDQVMHDYLRVLDRAGRRGFPRHPAQSPREYAHALRPALPEHVGAVDEITGHFVEARYSDHPIGTGTAERTKELSRTLSRALRSQEGAERAGRGAD